MTVAASLEIQILTGLTRLETDMKKVMSTVDGAMKSVNDSIQLAKKAFIAFGAVMTVDAFAGMIKGVADANGKLKDLATQTGASEAALYELARVGEYTETSAEAISGAMTKLAKNLVSVDDDGKGAAAALRSLGINVTDFKNLKPEDQMLALGKAMNQYEDGAGKSAAAMAIFGKEGAKLLPYLKDLGDSSDYVTEALTEQEIAYRKAAAAAGDSLGDNLTSLNRVMGDTNRALVEGMTPALVTASQAFLDVVTSVDGMQRSVKEAARDGSIATWTTNTVKGLSYVIDAAQLVARYIQGLGLSFAGLGAGVVAFLTEPGFEAGFAKFKAAMQAADDDIAKVYGTDTFGKQLRDRIDELNQMPPAIEKAKKPAVDYAGAIKAGEDAHKARAKAISDEEKAMQKQADMYAKLKSGIDEKTLAMQTELDTGEKMSEADKILNKLQSDMIAGVITLTNVQMQEIYAKLDLMRQTEELTEARKRENKEIEQNTKENADMLEKLQQATAATEKDIAAAKEANLTYGMTTQELQALSIARMYDTAKTYDQNAAFAEQQLLNKDLADQFRKQAEKLRELAALKEQGIHVKAARDAQSAWEQTTKSIGDGLVNALTRAVMDGKDIWLTFRNYMVTTILDGVLKNAIASVVSGAMQSMGFSAAGSAAPGLFGTAGSLFGGTGSATGGAATAGATLAGSTTTAATSVGATSAGAISASALQSTGVVAAMALGYKYLSGLGAQNLEIVDRMMIDDMRAYKQLNRDTGEIRYGLSEYPITAPSIDELRTIVAGLGGYDALLRQSAMWSESAGAGGFAMGGDHPGGWRIVGENGPEIEATGSARIFNATQTASMLKGNDSNAYLSGAIAELRAEMQQLARSAKQTADILVAVTRNGSSLRTTAA